MWNALKWLFFWEKTNKQQTKKQTIQIKFNWIKNTFLILFNNICNLIFFIKITACFLQEFYTLSPVRANGNASCAVKWQILWKTLVVVWQLVLVTLSRSDRSWLQFWSFLCFNEARVPFLVHSFQTILQNSLL